MEKFIFISFAFHFSVNNKNIPFFLFLPRKCFCSVEFWWRLLISFKINRKLFIHSWPHSCSLHKWINQWSVGTENERRARNYASSNCLWQVSLSHFWPKAFNESIYRKRFYSKIIFLWSEGEAQRTSQLHPSIGRMRRRKMYNKIHKHNKNPIMSIQMFSEGWRQDSTLNLVDVLAEYALDTPKHP